MPKVATKRDRGPRPTENILFTQSLLNEEEPERRGQLVKTDRALRVLSKLCVRPTAVSRIHIVLLDEQRCLATTELPAPQKKIACEHSDNQVVSPRIALRI
jgi:hypothetical protein